MTHLVGNSSPCALRLQEARSRPRLTAPSPGNLPWRTPHLALGATRGDLSGSTRSVRVSKMRRVLPASRPRSTIRFSLTLMVLSAAGCASLGPATVQRDRVDYISAIAESWKEQTLLNVVRLRYGDAPSFADVSSVISGYTFQGGLSAGASISSDLTATIPSNPVTVNGNATYIDRPTITYTPLTGDKFARSLLRPLPPSEIFELVQAGYPADNVLLLTTRAINGIYNQSGIGARARQADPEFYPLLDALRRLQLSGAVSIRPVKRGAEEVGMLILTAARRAQSVDQDLQFVRRTLGVTPDRNGEVSVSFGLLPHGPSEIALLTRSMAEILLEVGAGIEVPADHVAQGRTAAS